MSMESKFVRGDISAEARARKAESALKALQKERANNERSSREEAVSAELERLRALVEALQISESDIKELRMRTVGRATDALRGVLDVRARVEVVEGELEAMSQRLGGALPPPPPPSSSGPVSVPLPGAAPSPWSTPGGAAMRIPAGIVGGLFVFYLALKEVITLFEVIR